MFKDIAMVFGGLYMLAVVSAIADVAIDKFRPLWRR